MKGLDPQENVYEIGISLPSHKPKNIIQVGAYNNGLPRQMHEVLPKQEEITIIRAARNQDRAVSMGSKLGQVLWCHKVDPYYSLYKIEHLNLHQEVEVKFESFEFTENGIKSIDRR